MHTGALAFADYVRERRAQARQVRDDVQPRIPRSRMYALVRASATVVGAEGVHRVLCHRLAELGHDAYRDDAPVTAADGGGSPPASR